MEQTFDNSIALGYEGPSRRSSLHEGRPKSIHLSKRMSSEMLPARGESFRGTKQDVRGYPRYGVHKIVTYAYAAEKLLTLTLDLGLGGMKIRTHHAIPKNEQLNFNLVLGENSIRLKGRIAYSRTLPDKESVSGVQFTTLSAEDSTLLQKYLATVEAWLRPPEMLSAKKKASVKAYDRKTDEAQ